MIFVKTGLFLSFPALLRYIPKEQRGQSEGINEADVQSELLRVNKDWGYFREHFLSGSDLTPLTKEVSGGHKQVI